MRWWLALALVFTLPMLQGCGHVRDAKVETQIVEKAVPVPCNPPLPPRPALMTKAEIKAALAAAPTLDDRAKIITTQLLLYLGWTPTIEGALQGCRGTGG